MNVYTSHITQHHTPGCFDIMTWVIVHAIENWGILWVIELQKVARVNWFPTKR